MKLKLLKIANRALRPLGVQIYHEGLDMESVIRRLAPRASGIGTIIDIGASTGRWSAMAMPYFPDTRFIGVDPLREREPDLLRLKARNPNFDYVLCAAGEQDSAIIKMAVSGDLDGSTVGGSDGTVREVPLHSIDAIVDMKKCTGPFMLKFDTHGFEVPILNGANKTLQHTKYIVMEVYNYRHIEGTLLFYEMCALLDGMGFRCFNVVDLMQRPLDRSLWQMDFFFARKEDVVFRFDTYRASQCMP
jgi:FkbM family methyltransferase